MHLFIAHASVGVCVCMCLWVSAPAATSSSTSTCAVIIGQRGALPSSFLSSLLSPLPRNRRCSPLSPLLPSTSFFFVFVVAFLLYFRAFPRALANRPKEEENERCIVIQNERLESERRAREWERERMLHERWMYTHSRARAPPRTDESANTAATSYKSLSLSLSLSLSQP